MTFRTYFLTSSFLLVATGFLALVLTGKLDPISPILYAMALAGSWWIERREPERRISRRWAVRLSALAVPLYLADVFVFGGNPFLALGRFAFFLSAVKLLQVKEDSDWVWLYVLTFCELLLAAALTIDATFLAAFGLFLFFFLTSVSALEITRTHRTVTRVEEETHALRGDQSRPLRRASFLTSVSGAQFALVAIVSAPIFLFMPRFGGGAFGGTLAASETLSGFSDSVRLGEIENVKLSDATVMFVTLDRPATRALKWRGIALDTFDAERGTWSTKTTYRNVVSGLRGQSGTGFAQIEPLDAGKDLSDVVQQTFYLEPLTTRALFGAARVVAIDRSLQNVGVDQNGSLVGPGHGSERETYTIFSDVDPPSPDVLLADTITTYPAEIATTDLQTPAALDPRVVRLAEEAVGDARTPYEKAERIQGFLKTKYGYTLELTRQDTSLDAISDFLVNTKAGHCEYFASSMVLMLRSLGVPARLVNGFQTGELNPITGSYKVRQADAHSWVEVYFAGSGRWVEFDPTPAAGINQYPTTLAAQMRQSLDALQMMWIRYVVTLDSREQASVARSIQRRVVGMKDYVTGKIADVRAWMNGLMRSATHGDLFGHGRLTAVMVALLLIGGMAFAAMILQWRGWSIAGFVIPAWRWRSWLRRGSTPERSAVKFYEQMLTILARHGFARDPNETPREFARACGIEEVSRVTELYHRVRFGGATGREVEREVNGALAGLARRLRREDKDG